MLLLKQTTPAQLFIELCVIKEQSSDVEVAFQFNGSTFNIHDALAYHDILKTCGLTNLTVQCIGGLLTVLDLIVLAGVSQERRLVNKFSYIGYILPSTTNCGALEDMRVYKGAIDTSLSMAFKIITDTYGLTLDELIYNCRAQTGIASTAFAKNGLTVWEN